MKGRIYADPFFLPKFSSMKVPIICVLLFLTACGTSNKEDSISQPKQTQSIITDGDWRFSFHIEDEEIPFNVTFQNTQESNPIATIRNGESEIICSDFKITEDSIFIIIPIYETILAGRIESENLITGHWKDRKS